MTPYLAADIEHEEGRKLTAYHDSGGVLTIGVGHTGPDVRAGQTITNTQADAYLRGDMAEAVRELDRTQPWWRHMDDIRQDVMVQMMFQMGPDRLGRFVDTIKAAQRGDYARAADCMIKSKWATSDSPARARRMAMQMRSGVRAWARTSQAAPPPALPGGPQEIA